MTIEFTGTPPDKQEFRLYARPGTTGYVVTIQYNAAGAYVIYDADRRPVKATEWDHSARTWGEVQRRYCGEFRYEGVINRL